MPSIAKSTKWFVRVTAPWEFIKQKVPTMQGWLDYSGMMIAYHTGAKGKAKHAHIALVLTSELQKQSIDARLKKLFDVEKTNYSSKVWDGDTKALSYMYHDDKGEVVDYLGLSEEQITKIKEYNNVIQVAVKQAKEKASYRIVEYALGKLTGQPTRMEIGRCILRAVANREFHDPGDFMLERYINEVQLIMANDERELDSIITERLLKLRSMQ